MSLIRRYMQAKALADQHSREQLEQRFLRLQRLPNAWWAAFGGCLLYAAIAAIVYSHLVIPVSFTETALVTAGFPGVVMVVLGVMLRQSIRAREVTRLGMIIAGERESARKFGNVGATTWKTAAPLSAPPQAAPVTSLPAPPLQPPAATEPSSEDREIGGPSSVWDPTEPIPPKEKCH